MKFTSYQPKIVVVGSSSIDYVLKTNHHPQINETVLAEDTEIFFGGKGANQAIGTSRLGAKVYYIGNIGADNIGNDIIQSLNTEQVNTQYVHQDPQHPTGKAYVISAHGKTSIVVAPAANLYISKEMIDQAEEVIATADLVLTQLEIPSDIVEYLVEKCKKLQVKIGLYASPARAVCSDILEYSSFIVAKSKDLADILGNENREIALKKLPNKLFIRDDTNSTIYFNGEEMKYSRNDPDTIANKMGMGDAFTSGFAVAFCHGNSIDDCVKFGNRTSMKVAANLGSQRGLPFIKDLA
ncbi:PfkB family carbohydrate kinase [Elizabethkingia sp. JS20170427COW]|uniref:PfkB family carbohydrate kinase n=1 Tax=Elizabethkingia sp. JS20170427COW TaxID=2583851 RepID=UPI001110F6AD|nr:PfkB family carbohydrate kinase [Elizabethkingia sp. JS20170427COW]QCX52770.1 ribokinase [Elizabethkingia sp. JS20170427COW]